MPYTDSGVLTTDTREIAVSETWETQTDWENNQDSTNIEIVNGSIQLRELQFVPTTVLDNFESGDISFYSKKGGEVFSVNQNPPVLFNDYSVKVGGSNAGILYDTPADGNLPYYPQDGDTYGIYLWDDGGTAPCLYFKGNGDTGYIILVHFGNNVFNVWTASNGLLNNKLTEKSISPSSNTWYWVQVIEDSQAVNRFTIEWYDVNQSTGEINENPKETIAIDDNSYDWGGIGFGNMSSGNGVSFDMMGVR